MPKDNSVNRAEKNEQINADGEEVKSSAGSKSSIPKSEYDEKTGLRKKYLTEDMRKKTLGWKRGFAKWNAEQDAKAKQSLAGNAEDFNAKFTKTANDVVKKANK